MLHVDLSELAGGELQAKFDREITKVIQNMKDPNTPYQDARSITIKISLKQTELRDFCKDEFRNRKRFKDRGSNDTGIWEADSGAAHLC